jgi:hypothetical protein
MVQVSNPCCCKISLVSTASTSMLCPTQSIVTRGTFLRECSSRRVTLTTHLHLMPRSWKMELHFRSTICIYAIVLNWLSTGTLPVYPLSATLLLECLYYKIGRLLYLIWSLWENALLITYLLFLSFHIWLIPFICIHKHTFVKLLWFVKSISHSPSNVKRLMCWRSIETQFVVACRGIT